MSTTSEPGDQLELADLPPARARRSARSARRSGPKRTPARATDRPVARVAVDVSLPHLDRPFDYLVNEQQSTDAQPGARVRVRFAGRLVDGFVLERRAASDHEGRLSAISSVVSPVPVLTTEIATLCRAVADRYAGTFADVARLAIPPRHAAVERAHVAAAAAVSHAGQASNPDESTPETDATAWAGYRDGRDLLRALSAGTVARAAWCATPGVDRYGGTWIGAVVEAINATTSAGRGAIVVVPDHRDVDAVVRRGTDSGLSPVVLTADLGPRERYRRWLEVLSPTSDRPTVVVGTRAAVYAPVRNLGLIVVWDDGDDLHSEPRAPYPHVREVAALRSTQQECSLIVGGYARTAEAAAMVRRKFLHPVIADRNTVRAMAPRIRASADSSLRSGDDVSTAGARLPTVAWRVARDALGHGPVLVQVPRRGYLPRLACSRCGEQARCARCQGPLAIARDREHAACQWCGTAAGSWRCAACGGGRLRSVVIGARRTAEELGRAFPGVTVVRSGGRTVRSDVPDEPALVVATPGAEPVASSGYAAALLLDAWALLGRADLRAAEETLRRWMAASALVRGSADGGRVVVVADAGIRTVQALVRWDPLGHADAELAEREEVGLPPAKRIAVLQGAPGDVRDLLERVSLPPGADQLGPVPVAHRASSASDEEGTDVQVVLRVARRDGLELARALAAAQGERSVRKAPGWVTVRIDPVAWG